MADEKKESQNTPAAKAAPLEAPIPAPGQIETPPPAEAPAAAKPAETKKVATRMEAPANCSVCNKVIKKIRWYYREGKYYCTKRCWMTAKKKEAAKQAEGKTEGQAAETK